MQTYIRKYKHGNNMCAHTMTGLNIIVEGDKLRCCQGTWQREGGIGGVREKDGETN